MNNISPACCSSSFRCDASTAFQCAADPDLLSFGVLQKKKTKRNVDAFHADLGCSQSRCLNVTKKPIQSHLEHVVKKDV